MNLGTRRAGYARPSAFGAWLAAATLMVASMLLGGDADASTRRPVRIAVTGTARVCAGTLTVSFAAWRGRQPILDDGVSYRLEGLYVGAAAGPGGRWVPLDESAGGRQLTPSDGLLSWLVGGRGVPRQVRVAMPSARAVSAGVEPVWGCAA